MRERKLVVAALVREEGRILMSRRRPDQAMPNLWEFPGGKVEPGEHPEAALARELREELSVEAVIGEQLDSYPVSYGDGFRALLYFYRVTQFQGEPRNLDFEQIVWERPQRLPDYDFLEGDISFVSKVARWPEQAELR
jgi:8-oxo-dGTP diphosphatase